MEEPRHCDRYINDRDFPLALRWFLYVKRVPAGDIQLLIEKTGEPKLFAKYKGDWIRVVMASRLGDIGITTHLEDEYGYSNRVAVSDLSDFTDIMPRTGKNSVLTCKVPKPWYSGPKRR